ncbi:MAG: hypothetical protein K2G60_00930, partial [Oscillospiraceae bacterium]|nr:hypothetical protein [Oscillospiraceae bacterium]
EETNGGNVYVSVINVDFCGENVRGLATAVKKDYTISYQIQVPVFKGKYLASILYSTSSQQDAEEFIKRFSKV